MRPPGCADRAQVSPLTRVAVGVVCGRVLPCVCRSAEVSFLLLACDGVWDVMSNQEAVQFVYDRLREECTLAAANQFPTYLPKIADDLIQHCIADRFAHDNLSVVIVLLQPLCTFR